MVIHRYSYEYLMQTPFLEGNVRNGSLCRCTTNIVHVTTRLNNGTDYVCKHQRNEAKSNDITSTTLLSPSIEKATKLVLMGICIKGMDYR